MVDEPTLISIALRQGIPPALLQATLVRPLPDQVSTQYPGVAQDDTLAAEAVARSLSQAHQANGTWDRALNYYYSGNPDITPQHPAAAQANATIAQAGMNPTLGIGGDAVFSNPQGIADTFPSFIQSLLPMSQLGGVITPDAVKGLQWYSQQVVQQAQKQEAQAKATAAEVATTKDPKTGQPWGPGSLPSPAPVARAEQGDMVAAPFDPKYDTVNQPFGPTSELMEPGRSYQGQYYPHFHTGVDYAVLDHSPLLAAKDGTLTFSKQWGAGASGSGWEITLNAKDGTKYLYGHVSATVPIQNGTVVHAGDQIALSGGAGEPGSGMSTGAHLHFEAYDQNGQLVNGDPFVQSLASNPRPHPYATTPAPGLPKGMIPAGTTAPAGAGSDAKSRASDPQPSAADVGGFVKQAQAAGIHDPQAIIDTLPMLAPIYRMFNRTDPSLQDVARHVGLSQAQIHASLMGDPHKQYPTITNGQYQTTMMASSLFSAQHVQRMPLGSEVARLVALNAGPKDMEQYYSGLAAQAQPAAAQPQPSPQAQPPSQNGNVVQMPQRDRAVQQ